MPNIDLHFHSTYSDGKLPVSVIADLIKSQGLKYCALTDHDSVAGVVELKKYLTDTGIVLIPATELTALFGDCEIHLLAYGFDIGVMEKVLHERNVIVKEQKVSEMKQSIALFKAIGIEVGDDLVPVEKKPVGFTVASAIVANENNQLLFMERHGRKLNRDDIFFEYQVSGKPCAVKRSGVTVQWLLKKLDGIVKDFIIGHPFVSPSIVMKPLERKNILELLEMGVTGLEIFHDETSVAQIEWLHWIVEEKKLNYTGGSDFHGSTGDLPLGYYNVDKEVPSFKLKEYYSQ